MKRTFATLFFLSIVAFVLFANFGSTKTSVISGLLAAVFLWLYRAEIRFLEDREIGKLVVSMLENGRLTFSYIRAELICSGYEIARPRLSAIVHDLVEEGAVRKTRIMNTLTRREETYYELLETP